MDKELREARELVERIKSGNIGQLGPLVVCSYLEILAKAGDEKSFRIIANAYANQIRLSVSRSDVLNPTERWSILKKDICDNPYSYIEWLCMISDCNDKISFSDRKSYRTDPKNPPEIRRTQKFFQKLYGSRFYQDCAILEDKPRIFRIKDYRR